MDKTIDRYNHDFIPGERGRTFSRKYPQPWHFGEVMGTLLHEFVDVRNPKMQHPPRFYRLLRESKRALVG